MGKSYEKSNFLNLPVNILYPEHVLTLRLDSPSLTISAAEFDDAGPFSPISLAKFSIELNKSIKFFFKINVGINIRVFTHKSNSFRKRKIQYAMYNIRRTYIHVYLIFQKHGNFEVFD